MSGKDQPLLEQKNFVYENLSPHVAIAQLRRTQIQSSGGKEWRC
jgi:hypothetical protein